MKKIDTQISKSLKEAKGNFNLFTELHKNGRGLTYDDQGIPILQKMSGVCSRNSTSQ